MTEEKDNKHESKVRRNAAGVPVSEEGLDCWKQLQAGRVLLLEKMPYYDAAVTLLAPVEYSHAPTCAVTETAIFLFNPEYIVSLSVEAVAGHIVHEVSHLMRNTHGRTRALGCVTDDQRKLSNIAADIPINDDIEAAGIPVVARYGGVGAATYGLALGLTHEEYYAALLKMADSNKVKMPQKPKCGHGWCGSGGGMPIENEPKDGSGDGNESNGNKGDAKNGNYGFIGRTPAEIEQARNLVAQAVMKAQASRGNVPAGLQRWASEILTPPVVPWERRLQRTLRYIVQYVMGKVDTTYTKRSRRQGVVGTTGYGAPIMPGWRKPHVPVVFMMDTSGSMGTEDLDAAGAELIGVLRATGSDVLFASVDAEVHTMRSVNSWKEARQYIVGGGGTDFHSFFAYLEKLPKEKRPRVAIIATDGDAGVPSEPPRGLEVIWVITRRGGHAPTSWGTTIHLADAVAENAEAGPRPVDSDGP